jgi:GT2 family glycosyltransferase
MEFFNHKNTEILIVNYNTPDYIIELHNQIRNFVSEKMVINVVDGSDNLLKNRGVDYIVLDNKMKNILNEDKFSNHYLIGYNIHHGPGMDYGLKKIQKKYALILDSDIRIKKGGLLELFSKQINTENFICIGDKGIVNNSGFDDKVGIEYVHPRAMIIKISEYLTINESFHKHGAPCLNFMKKVKSEKLTNKLIHLSNDILNEYLILNGRGTVKIFGYNL